jgi:F0F1-type ATP synthase delta subunit
MSDFDNIGKLMHLRLDSIESSTDGKKTTELDFTINVAAEYLSQSERGNWIPVIVKETGDYQYEVVSNNFVYLVAQKARLERVWCIVIEPSDREIEQAKILAGEITPKININTASKENILSALQHLISQPGSALKGVDPLLAADKIARSNRAKWQNLTPISSLKCGITKGKKIDALDRVFFVSPALEVTPTPLPKPPSIASVKNASRDEIFDRLNYLSTYKIGGFEAIDIEAATDLIFTASKGKWKSLNPIAKLECGIDTSKIKTLKTLFCL